MLPSSRATAAAIVVALCACGGDTVDVIDDDGGAGGSTITTAAGGFGGMPSMETGGNGGAGGASGGAFTWSEPPLHLEEHCLGEVAIGAYLSFDIPPNTFGLTVVGRAAAEDTIIGLERLRPGNSADVIASFDIPGKDLDSFVDVGVVAGANPQSDLPQAQPTFVGDWSARFGDDGTGAPVDVCVYARRSVDGQPHGGVLDVNVRVTSGTSNGYVQAVLDNLFANYFGPNLGVTAGNISFGALAAEWDVIGSSGELIDMFRSSAGIGPRPALNLFVINDFSGADFGSAIGVAGGIPGTPVVHGTAQSGVAYQPSGDGDYDAAVLAHEIGHLAGLWHTTEVAVSETDPLSDTPVCPNIGGDPSNCPDVNNLMFPIAYSGTVFTADQITVLQGSALYRGRTTSGGQPGGSLSGTTSLSLEPPPAVAIVVPQTRRTPSEAVERLLSSVWCAHGGTDHLALVNRLATRERLLELARDDGAFDLTRSRALATLSRFAASVADRRQIFELAVELRGSLALGHATAKTVTEILTDKAATPR